MIKEKKFDPVVLILLFGIYFVISFASEYNVLELLYGIILIGYYFKCRGIQKKCL